MGTKENAARILARAPEGATPADRLRWLARIESELTPDVARHASKVAWIAGGICASLGMSQEEIAWNKVLARWHDIGKPAVDREIRNKPGPFVGDEYAQMKLHTDVGVEMLGPGFPDDFVGAVKYHHERYDGYGYYGLKGEDIPFSARIVAIADVVEALTAHDRPYKDPMPEADALMLMTADVTSPGFGRRAFDPYIMRQFVATRLSDPEFQSSLGQRNSLWSYARSNPMSDLPSDPFRNDGWVVKDSGERLLYSFSDVGHRRLDAIMGRTGHATFRRKGMLPDTDLLSRDGSVMGSNV